MTVPETYEGLLQLFRAQVQESEQLRADLQASRAAQAAAQAEAQRLQGKHKDNKKQIKEYVVSRRGGLLGAQRACIDAHATPLPLQRGGTHSAAMAHRWPRTPAQASVQQQLNEVPALVQQLKAAKQQAAELGRQLADAQQAGQAHELRRTDADTQALPAAQEDTQTCLAEARAGHHAAEQQLRDARASQCAAEAAARRLEAEQQQLQRALDASAQVRGMAAPCACSMMLAYPWTRVPRASPCQHRCCAWCQQGA
jgi:hypothetical protein